MTVAIVTDSTAYLPPNSRDGIAIVPVQVVLGGQSFDEVGALTTAQLVEAIRSGQSATTSRPSAAAFETLYSQLRDAGASSIVSIHLSSGLSGTFESATLAANRMDIPVTAIDSGQVAMAMGFAVRRAADSAQRGAAHEDVVAQVQRDCTDSLIAFSVDTLEFLERGGRIGSVAARVGGALQVKPILQLVEGKIERRDLVRTGAKAFTRLVDIAMNSHEPGRQLAVHHVADPSSATMLAQALTSRLGVAQISVTECGAVIAAHTGPGALAVVVGPHL